MNSNMYFVAVCCTKLQLSNQIKTERVSTPIFYLTQLTTVFIVSASLAVLIYIHSYQNFDDDRWQNIYNQSFTPANLPNASSQGKTNTPCLLYFMFDLYMIIAACSLVLCCVCLVAKNYLLHELSPIYTIHSDL